MNIPNGFKLVPVEPTDDMVISFAETWYSKRQAYDDPDMDDAYRDMLAAAPTPPQPIYCEAKERELFESYASIHYRLQELPLDFDDGEYIEPEVQYSWESWQARAKAGEVGHE